MLDDSVKGPQRLRQIRAEVKDDETFQKIVAQWKRASQTRLWIMEKKKNLSKKLEKSLTATFIQEKKEKLKREKKKQKQTKPDQDEESKDEQANENSTSNASKETKAEMIDTKSQS
jgi:hypothetical protein